MGDLNGALSEAIRTHSESRTDSREQSPDHNNWTCFVRSPSYNFQATEVRT
jgi:hypothetical protein